MSKFSLPKVLTFMRSIDPSPAVFYGVNSATGEKAVVEISDLRLRGTFSDYKTGFSGKKSDSDLAEGNLQHIESAYLPLGHDSLLIEFSFKVLNNSVSAYSASTNDARKVLSDFVVAYQNAGGVTLIAKEYVKALLRGDFLWRNQKIMENTVIALTVNNTPYRFELPNDGNYEGYYAKYATEIDAISAVYAEALITPYKTATFKVSALGVVGDSQQVFPSQEFTDKDKAKASRVLAKRNFNGKNPVIFTAEKVGNALRRIDIWYDEAATYPLPVEPFGIDRGNSIAIRKANKNDFYTLVEKRLLTMTESLLKGESITGDMHFVFACLVRGGVYNGDSGK